MTMFRVGFSYKYNQNINSGEFYSRELKQLIEREP